MTGHITRKRNDRGFCFIRLGTEQVPGDMEYFAHARDFLSGSAFIAMDVGDEVTFEAMEPEPKEGPRALTVRAAVVKPVARVAKAR